MLDFVPADANAEAQPSAGEHCDLGALFYNQGRLSLRQDDHAGHELDRPGHARDEAE
jgi:hypothetical protein